MNHSHILYDSDPHFKIDPISRKITNESSTKTTLIQHDHNSERFTFEVPRYVEGHDLSQCNVVEIHYLNVEANTKNVRAGVYTVDDLQVKADEENTVVCSWMVSHHATQLVGQLNFLVRFSCVSDGVVEYVWNTAIYSGISVSSGIYNSDSPSDTPVPAYNFVTTINGDVLKFFVGTQAEYNALSAEDQDGLFAIISDDKTKEEIFEAIANLNEVLEGKRAVPWATNATNATNADHATNATNATNADHATNVEIAERAEIANSVYIDWNYVGDTSSIYGIETGLYVVVVDVNPSETTKHKYFTSVIWCDGNANDSIGSTARDASHIVEVHYTSLTANLFVKVSNTNGGGATSDTYKIVRYKKISTDVPPLIPDL